MSQEWNKVNIPGNLPDLTKGLESYLSQMKEQLEQESKKVQGILDVLLVELQNHIDSQK